MRKRATASDDLPAPVRPTTPTRVRGAIANESDAKTGRCAEAYFIATSSKTIAPSAGHLGTAKAGLRDDVGVDVLAARDDARDGRGRTPTAVQGVGFSGVGVRDATDEWRFVARARRADVDQGEGDDRGEGAICGARSGADGACCARRLGVRR